MKTENQLNAEILEMTMKIQEQFPELSKYIAEINAYLSLKRRVEYGLYQYGKFLGQTLDVSV